MSGKMSKTKNFTSGFLFDVTQDIKQFYETCVIFFTKVDYSDRVFDNMTFVRTWLTETEITDNSLMNNIVDFHLKWLVAVDEIEKFRKSSYSKEEVLKAISFTIDAMYNRLKHYKRFTNKYSGQFSESHQMYLRYEIEIVEEMHKEMIKKLEDKITCYKNFTDDTEFRVKAQQDIDELLNWLDQIYDKLSNFVTKYLDEARVFPLRTELAKTLQTIVVDSIQGSESLIAQNIIGDLKRKGKQLSSMIRGAGTWDLEISKIYVKLNLVDDILTNLDEYESEENILTPAITELKIQKEYLECRLLYLEKSKVTIKELYSSSKFLMTIEELPDDDDELCICKDFLNFKIFNYMLPNADRRHLVKDLCRLWDKAVLGGSSPKSGFSLTSFGSSKEEFTDELGNFTIDEYERKIYKFPSHDILYQPNELNELVPLSDDKDHIYFYDECGRYFVHPETKQNVYKAHASASEYMMGSAGVLFKTKEVRHGKTYYYDDLGRYHVNEDGKHIYQEEDAASEYENDGLGNLVRIRELPDLFDLCPEDVCVTEDFKYLQGAVGSALVKCIAEVILHQPVDPIKDLSSRLIKYRENIQLRDKRAREQEELEIERAEIKNAAERAAREALLQYISTSGESDNSFESNPLGNLFAINVEDKAEEPIV